MRFFGVPFFLTLLFFHYPSFSKINDKRVYDNMYNACVENPRQLNSREISIYCACFASDVMERFTVKELIELEMGILAAKDDEAKIRIAASNSKIEKIAIKCITEIIN